jgi:hypothetical protein
MAKKHRSPSYPALPLTEAVDRAKVLYGKEGRNKMAIHAAVRGWGYSEKSSGGMAAIAALKAWGLLEDEGSGKERRVWLSPRGLTIVRDKRENSPDRTKHLSESAAEPKVVSLLYEEFGAEPVSDDNLRYFLESHEYNPNAVKDIIAVYRDALSYLTNETGGESGDGGGGTGEENQVSVGDMVQWESGGVLQFAAPRRVRALEVHHGAKWAFVEGSDTGIPVKELTVEAKGSGVVNPPPVLPEEPRAKQERLEGRLSKTTTYQLLISGDLGPREIGKLIKVLQAQKEVLADDGEDPS